MSASVQVNDREVLLGLGEFRASVADRTAIYNILGQLMMSSITQTFRDQGSPAGSWPKLALSTMKRKGYTAGHMLLRLSNRLFNSIRPVIQGDDLVIGTGEGIPYAQVHQFGSADRLGGSIGPQAKLADRSVMPYDYSRRLGFGRVLGPSGKGKGKKTRIEGPGRKIHVEQRHQNIPARPYLVFRPEDPDKMVEALDRYIMLRSGTLEVTS